MLLQEAQCCDRTLRNFFCSSATNSKDHLVRVFTKLMLQVNILAAVRWITERAGGGLLNPEDSVVKALLAKYPEPRIPSDSVFPSCEDLPYFEDSEITATHVRIVASCIQGGAGPGGCQSMHWREVLLWRIKFVKSSVTSPK